MAEASLTAGAWNGSCTLASTAWVYGFDAGPGTNELSDRHPSGDSYCDTKLETENLVRELVERWGLPGVIVQPTEVYGPGDRQAGPSTPLRMIKSGRMMLPDGGKGVIQPIYVDDAVEGILAAARRGAVGGAYLLCGPAVVSCSDFFGRYAEMVGGGRMPAVPKQLAEAMAAALTGLGRATRRPGAYGGLCGGSACRPPTTEGKPDGTWVSNRRSIWRRACRPCSSGSRRRASRSEGGQVRVAKGFAIGAWVIDLQFEQARGRSTQLTMGQPFLDGLALVGIGWEGATTWPMSTRPGRSSGWCSPRTRSASTRRAGPALGSRLTGAAVQFLTGCARTALVENLDRQGKQE